MYGHDQITRHAWEWAADHPETFPFFQRWISSIDSVERKEAEELLARSVADVDMIPDVYGKVVGYGAVTGGKQGNQFAMLTTFFHYVIIDRPGKKWNYDGFSYRTVWGGGFDQLLALPFTRLYADLSPAFGGQLPLPQRDQHGHVHGRGLGEYFLGFKGTHDQWRSMYRAKNAHLNAVMPPAYVPAELAWREFLASPIAEASSEESWEVSVPYVNGLLSGASFARHFQSGHVRGLPVRFDRLGMTLHLAQDMAVPHHAHGTVDYCHDEFENAADRLLCGVAPRPSVYDSFLAGSQPRDPQLCRAGLNGAKIEAALLVLGARHREADTLEDIFVAQAKASGRWFWGDPIRSVDRIGTQLPNGYLLTADRCDPILRVRMVEEQLSEQLHQAVGITAYLLERAARAQLEKSAEELQ